MERFFRIKDHDGIDEFGHELLHKVNQRNQYPTNSQPYAKVFREKIGQEIVWTFCMFCRVICM